MPKNDVFDFFEEMESLTDKAFSAADSLGEGAYGRLSVSSVKDWNTPPGFVTSLRELFGTISLDPCSNPWSCVKAETEYGLPERDGLNESWDYPTIFANPPYGRDKLRGTTIHNWLQRCSHANRDYGSEVVALVPVAPNTRHWKDHVFPTATSICFCADARFKFWCQGKYDPKGAPLAICAIYWGRQGAAFERRFGKYGNVVHLRTPPL